MTTFITRRNFTSSLKSVGAITQNMETVAAFILEQAHIHRNLSPAIEAFKVPSFRDQRDNKLNTLGNQLKNYLLAHSRYIKIENVKDTHDTLVTLRTKLTGQEEQCIVDVAASRKAGERVFFAKPVTDIGATLIGFKDFTDHSNAPSKPNADPMTAKQLSTRLANVVKALDERGLAALPAELETLLTELDTVRAMLLKHAASSVADDIELAAFEQSLNVKPSSKSKAAPKAS